MELEAILPITADPWWMLGVFALLLLVFHVLFLKVWKLSRLGWKRVDYFWLGCAALGLLAGATEVRRLLAGNLVEGQRQYVAASYDSIRVQLRLMTGAVVCRQFQRTEFSPHDLEQVQKEYDAVCSFAKQAQQRLSPEPPESVEVLKSMTRPVVGDQLLNDILTEFDLTTREYERIRRLFDDMRVASERSTAETAFAIAAPLLLAFALALRITKVSGEIALEA
ncbi:MAG: hypothetical protein HY675_03560 [Chloroflexi bacterium]|nr:hypothetical protein [Chloroflexota bacterium]